MADNRRGSPEGSRGVWGVNDRPGEGEAFPRPRRNDGGTPCVECHLKPGETCDVCGAIGETSMLVDSPPGARGHSPLGMSVLERRYCCPGSMKAEEGRPNTTSVYAKRGTD